MSRYAEVCAQLQAAPKTWLITGVAGFIGCNLLETLLKLDQRVVGLDNFATGHQRQPRRGAGQRHSRSSGHASTSSKATSATWMTASAPCNGVDYVLHQAALGSVPRSLEDPITTNGANIDGFLNMLVAARDATGKTLRLRRLQLHLRRPSRPAQGGRQDRQTAVALRRHQIRQRAVRRRVRPLLRLQHHRPALLQRLRPRQDPEGAYAAVIPKWIASMIANEPVYINGDGETSRDFCYVDNAVQANLLAATTDNPEAVNQVYNVAVGDRTTLNELCEHIRRLLAPRFPHLETFKPTYRDFRAGDVRHSLADISKAQRLLGYAPTHRLGEGLAEAMEWYVGDLVG